MEITRHTVDQRTRQYKWLVMTVALGALLSITAIVAFVAFEPLLISLLLPAAANIFFTLDLRQLNKWRHCVLASWADGNIKIDSLAAILLKIPGLPHATVESMLNTLPHSSSDLLSYANRIIIAQADTILAGIALQASLVRSINWALAAGFAVGAVSSGRSIWLLGLILVFFVWRGWLASTKRHMARSLTDLSNSMRSLNADIKYDNSAIGPFGNLFWDDVPSTLSIAWRSMHQR